MTTCQVRLRTTCRRLRRMRRVAWIFLLTVGAAGTAAAREPDPQAHEVDADLQIAIQQSYNNAANIDAQYTYTPGGIDRNSELPAVLRRFILHPSSVWLHIYHVGATREVHQFVTAGADLQPFGGVVYARVEGGVGRHLTIYDEPFEYGYTFAVLRGEVGVRPLPQLTVGAFYRGEPTLGVVHGNNPTLEAERSGAEHRFGVTTTFATPDDRLYATIEAWGRITDWTFSNVPADNGDITVRGYGASARLAYNASLTTTLQIRGNVARDHWVNTRPGDVNQSSTFGHYIGPNPDRQVWSAEGFADLLYWMNGRWGFRVSAGGGYLQAPPLFNTQATAEISVGGGIMLRF